MKTKKWSKKWFVPATLPYFLIISILLMLMNLSIGLLLEDFPPIISFLLFNLMMFTAAHVILFVLDTREEGE